jgi:hypothetical protein
MSKKPKRPSVADKLAKRLYPEGTIDHAMQRKRFVKVVGPAIRLAVRETWHSAKRSESVWNKKDIETKYGVTL